jgi:hypothetical protein
MGGSDCPVLRRRRRAERADLCEAGLRFTTGGEVTTRGRLVSGPRTFEHLDGLGYRLPLAMARAGFHRLALRVRFASAIRFRDVRSSFPVAVSGIWSRTTISSGALYPILARANWISSWLAGRSVPSARVM